MRLHRHHRGLDERMEFEFLDKCQSHLPPPSPDTRLSRCLELRISFKLKISEQRISSEVSYCTPRSIGTIFTKHTSWTVSVIRIGSSQALVRNYDPARLSTISLTRPLRISSQDSRLLLLMMEIPPMEESASHYHSNTPPSLMIDAGFLWQLRRSYMWLYHQSVTFFVLTCTLLFVCDCCTTRASF